METGALIITFAICYIPIIVIFSILPYIGRRTLTFGVSIPSAVHDDERLKKLRGSFAAGVVILGAVLCGLSILPFVLLEENLAVGLMTALIFVYIAVIFLLYIRNFRQVKQLKEQEGWAQDAAMKAVADTKFATSKRSVSALWFLLYVVIIIGTLLAGILLYDQIPDEVAMQMDYSGNPTRIVQKSFGLILFAPAMQAVMALLIGFIYWMMQKTPPVIDPEQPEVTSAQNTKFRYRWSAFTVFTGLILTLIFFTTQLWITGLMPQWLVLWLPMAAVGLIVVAAVVLSVKTGQSGSRIRTGKTKDGKKINRDDDKYWKNGMFYVNKDDPALFVEKRFGVGFTLNFGRPAAILIFVGVLAVIAVIAILSSALAG